MNNPRTDLGDGVAKASRGCNASPESNLGDLLPFFFVDGPQSSSSLSLTRSRKAVRSRFRASRRVRLLVATTAKSLQRIGQG